MPNQAFIRQYVCTVTGLANSLPDLVMPISSVSLRMSLEGVSSLSVVCSNGVDFGQAIAARKDGGLLLTSMDVYPDGTVEQSVYDEYAIASIYEDRGASSWSFTVRGNTSLTNASPKEVSLSGTSYLSQREGGVLRARCNPDRTLLPGDTAVLEDATEFVVSAVTLTVSMTGSSPLVQMEVTDG